VKVFKHIYNWIDERVEMHEYIKKDILDKPIPKGLNLSYCFGGITFFLFLMLTITGYFMTLYYVPTPTQAYDAVDFMTYEVSMGYIIRGVHHWAANLMIVTIALHMIRVYIYGAYKKPREINWMTGVLLLCMVMGFGFTGYLFVVGDYVLRITRGGTELGALTLTRFYTLHVVFLPIATVVLLIGHFAMIRRQGISTPL
jgi:menaquinol-cytochrome c reductase cytochrome b subunit